MLRPRHAAPAIAMTILSLIIAACASGPAASPSELASPSEVASTRIEVSLTDALRIEPGSMTVPVGVPVTFVVTNTGVLPHEFYLGDETAQAAHEADMSSGGMAHDMPDGIGLDPGETKELTLTFEAVGETLAGCHVPGHYAAGMRAAITVGP